MDKPSNNTLRIWVPVALFFAGYLFLGIWWSSKLDARVAANELWIQEHKPYTACVQQLSQWVEDHKEDVAQIPRLEERLDTILRTLHRIESKLFNGRRPGL